MKFLGFERQVGALLALVVALATSASLPQAQNGGGGVVLGKSRLPGPGGGIVIHPGGPGGGVTTDAFAFSAELQAEGGELVFHGQGTPGMPFLIAVTGSALRTNLLTAGVFSESGEAEYRFSLSSDLLSLLPRLGFFAVLRDGRVAPIVVGEINAGCQGGVEVACPPAPIPLPPSGMQCSFPHPQSPGCQIVVTVFPDPSWSYLPYCTSSQGQFFWGAQSICLTIQVICFNAQGQPTINYQNNICKICPWSTDSFYIPAWGCSVRPAPGQTWGGALRSQNCGNVRATCP